MLQNLHQTRSSPLFSSRSITSFSSLSYVILTEGKERGEKLCLNTRAASGDFSRVCGVAKMHSEQALFSIARDSSVIPF